MRTLWIGGAVLSLALSGCTMDAEREEPVVEQRIGFETRDRERATFDGRVPASAMRLSDWENDRLTFRPASAGRIYVLDDQYNLVYSGSLEKDQPFIFDRRTGRATVEGQTVFERTTAGSSQYDIYFDQR